MTDFKFTKSTSIATRVAKIVKADIDNRGETWLLNLGYAECNDYAELVKFQVSQASGNEYVRFETIARNIRSIKASIRPQPVQA